MAYSGGISGVSECCESVLFLFSVVSEVFVFVEFSTESVREVLWFCKSGCGDLNPGLPTPEAGALPDCATPRTNLSLSHLRRENNAGIDCYK